ERDTAIEQGDGALPGDREFPGDPPVLLGPAPLAVRRGAVIADRFRDTEVISRHRPEPAEGRQRGRYARHVMLADETHRQQNAGEFWILDFGFWIAGKGCGIRRFGDYPAFGRIQNRKSK